MSQQYLWYQVKTWCLESEQNGELQEYGKLTKLEYLTWTLGIGNAALFQKGRRSLSKECWSQDT